MKHYKIKQSITDRSSLSVDYYLKDIGKFPLLTEKEERLLTKEKEKNNKEAYDKLVESNLRFVVSIAKQYQGKGVELEDLISAGNLGLMEAVNRYSLSYNCRFLSYAVWWIRDYIIREIMTNGNTIRVPVGKSVLINRMNRVAGQFEQENERNPTYEGLGKLWNWTEKDSEDIASAKIIKVENSTTDDDGHEISIFDKLEAEEVDSDREIKDEHKTTDILEILRQELSHIEFDIITSLFGIGRSPKTLDEIADDCEITRERVRQIKDKAIIRLRRSSQINKLQNYL